MMNKKHLITYAKKIAFLGIMGFFVMIPLVVCAQSPGESIFQEALNTLYTTFQNARVVVYVTAGFGLIGVAVAAISGKLPWRWFSMIAVALFTLAAAEKIIAYVTNTNLGNAPQSDFTSELGDSEFRISTGSTSDSFNFDTMKQNSANENPFQ